MLFGQISLPQSPRQETFWASTGIESTEESVTVSDVLLKYYQNFIDLNQMYFLWVWRKIHDLFYSEDKNFKKITGRSRERSASLCTKYLIIQVTIIQ